MMQTLRIVIALAVVAASVAGFAAWLKLRTPTADPNQPAAVDTASPAGTASDEAQAQRELEVLQEKLAAAIKNDRGPAAVVAEARALVKRHPDFAPGYVTLAQVLSVQGHGDEAYTHLVKALDLNPRQPEVHDLAGSLAFSRQKPTEAQQHYAAAVGLEPRNAKYRLHLAVAQLKERRYDEARNSLLQVLKLDSSSHQAYAVMADLHGQQNKTDQALDAINRALELVNDEQAYRESYLRQKAALLRRANRADEALVVLRQLPAKRWIEQSVIDEFAQTYMMLGQPQKAAEHYEAVLPLDPLADWAAERAAQYRLKAGQKDEARRALESLRRINPRAASIPEIEAALR